MLYDSSNPIDVERAKKRFNSLLSSNKTFELSDKSIRNISQNNYLHLLIHYLAGEIGETAEYTKEYLYKIAANKDIFLVYSTNTDDNSFYVRSSSSITKEEMTLSIERFRNFASQTYDVYLPAPNEEEYLKHLQMEVQRNSKFI